MGEGRIKACVMSHKARLVRNANSDAAPPRLPPYGQSLLILVARFNWKSSFSPLHLVTEREYTNYDAKFGNIAIALSNADKLCGWYSRLQFRLFHDTESDPGELDIALHCCKVLRKTYLLTQGNSLFFSLILVISSVLWQKFPETANLEHTLMNR